MGIEWAIADLPIFAIATVALTARNQKFHCIYLKVSIWRLL
ncbi:MAG: hypothetical protein ACBR12_03275 [Microcoleus sp.]